MRKRLIWIKEEYIETLKLYSKLKKEGVSMNAKNPDVIALSEQLERDPSSIAMRLQNFEYYATGGKAGLRNGSRMCNEIYDELQEELGLPRPLPQATTPSDAYPRPETISTDLIPILNEVVLNIAMAVKDINLVKSENIDLFTSLTTICRYIDTSYFTLDDLSTLSRAIKSIPAYPNNLLSLTLQSCLPEDQFNKINNLISLFI